MVLCSVSNYDQKYMINGNDYSFIPEKLYENTYNDYPYRFYFSNSAKKKLLIKNLNKNYSKIYLRSLFLFNDFIPIDYTFKYIDLTKITGKGIPSLLFATNFAEVELQSTQATLTYSIYDENNKLDNKAVLNYPATATFELSNNFVFLPLCEPNQKYNPSTNLCEPINITNLNAINAIYCLDDNTPLACMTAYYLNIEVSGITCQEKCPNNLFRLPGHQIVNKGICNTKCPSNIEKCPNSGQTYLQFYSDNMSCLPNYTRIGLKCLPKADIKNSAFYYSRCYNQPNIHKYLTNTAKYSNGYYLELWLKIDPINLHSCQTTATETVKDLSFPKYYYLYANPHAIFYDSTDGQYKYQANNLFSATQSISLVETEWNIIIIKTEIPDNIISLYMNYNLITPVATFTLQNIYDLKLSELAFCSSDVNGDCGSNELKWGSAYYRDFRIWDIKTSTMEMIQAFGQGVFSQTIKSLLTFYPLTIEYLDNDIIQELINSDDKIDVMNAYSSTLLYTTDKTILYNYSTKFDWGAFNPNKLLSSIVNGVVSSNNCGTGCKRCYSTSSSECYKCDDGYILQGKACRQITHYYVKIPIGSGNVLDLKIKEDNGYNLEKEQSYTITFFMKIFGVKSEVTINQPAILKLSADFILYFDWKNSVINMSYSGTTLFVDRDITKYLGVWVPVAIANFIGKESLNEIYPHMFTLSIDRIDMPFSPTFQKIPSTGLKISQIAFGNEVVGLIADLRVYNKFIQGAYGRIMGDMSLRNKDLLFQINLYGNTKDNCISDNGLTLTVSQLKVECFGDYIDYLDETKRCNDNSKYFDYSLQSCESCHSSCTTNCFGSTEKNCTCDMSEGLYWLKKDSDGTYCEPIPYVDFSSLDRTVVNMIEASTTNESTLEFWVYIYTYVTGKKHFQEMDIEWNLHNRIVLKRENGVVKSNCYPLVNVDNYNKFQEVSTIEIEENIWVYVRCGTNINKKKYAHSIKKADQTPKFIESNLVNYVISRPETVMFQIFNVGGKKNYGFVFLKNIKLWQQYNFNYIDTANINLISYDKFPGLMSYYINDYNGDMRIVDVVDMNNLVYSKLTRFSDFIGYNYVDFSYKNLILCSEGTVKDTNDACLTPNGLGANCELGGYNDKCIYCTQGYLIKPSTGECTQDCGDKFYPEYKINQCRDCHTTCATCNGPYYNNCTKCTGIYYLNTKEKTCIEVCEREGLISFADSVNGNICKPFDVEAILINVSEDELIDIKTFTEIQAQIIGSARVTTKWGFDRDKTIFENANDPSFTVGTDPFIGSLTQLSVSVDNSFFQLGRKYDFFLEITVERGGIPVTVEQHWLLTMNNSPQEGDLLVIPTVGLRNTTSFIMDCRNWIDDNTDNLLYRFYYIEENTVQEIKVTDWMDDSETFSMVDVRNYQQPITKITVYCEIKDKFDEVSKTSYEITISNDLSNGYYSIFGALNDYYIQYLPTDLNLLGRSELLKSLGIDPFKINSPEFRISYFEPSLDQTEILLYDPDCTESYCNSYGTCYFVDLFLSCSCQMGYTGTNCHLDKNGYVKLVEKYEELFDKIILMVNNTISDIQLQCVHNLFEGASYFIQDDSFFQNAIESFVSFAKALPQNTVLSKLNSFFDLYNYYFSSVVQRIAQEKATLKESTGSENRTIYLPEETIKEYNKPINYIITQLESLLSYVVSELKTTQIEYEYSTDYLYVSLTQINPTFNDNSYFENRKQKYKSHVNFMKCVNNYEIQNLNNPYYQAWFGFIEFQINPFFYNETFMENNTSPFVSILFFDATTGKSLPLSNCTGEDALVLNFPFTSYQWIELFNKQKFLYDPRNYKGSNNEIFNDPIYINKSGYVSNDTVEDRIEKYHRQMNFSCQYYLEKNGNWNESGIDYVNFTSDENFLVCHSNHATKFTSFFIPNNITYGTGSRFYYLKHPELFKYGPNYLSNTGFWIMFGLAAFCLLLLLIFTCIDYNYFRQKSLLEFLKKEIVKAHFPYNQKTEKEINEIIPNACDPKALMINREKRENGFMNFDIKSDIEDNFDETEDKNSRNDYLKMEKGLPNANGQDLFLDIPNAPPIKTKGFFDSYDINHGLEQPAEIYPKIILDSTERIQNGLTEKELVPITTRREQREQQKSHLSSNNAKSFTSLNGNKSNESNGSIKTSNQIVFTKEKQSKHVFYKNKIDDKNGITIHNNQVSNIDENLKNMESYGNVNLTTCKFFTLNLKERHKLLNLLFKMTVFHSRWKKLSLFFTECCLMMLFNTIFLTLDEKVILSSNLGGVIGVAILSLVLSIIAMYFFPFFFRVSTKQQKRLYDVVISGGQLIVLKEYEQLTCTNSFFIIIGIIFSLIIWGGTFYFSFGFTSVWRVQLNAWLVCNGISFFVVYIICEILIEGLIAILYIFRKKGKWPLACGYWLNQMRNYRVLWP